MKGGKLFSKVSMFLCCDEASIKIAGHRNYGRLYGQSQQNERKIGKISVSGPVSGPIVIYIVMYP